MTIKLGQYFDKNNTNVNNSLSLIPTAFVPERYVGLQGKQPIHRSIDLQTMPHHPPLAAGREGPPPLPPPDIAGQRPNQQGPDIALGQNPQGDAEFITPLRVVVATE